MRTCKNCGGTDFYEKTHTPYCKSCSRKRQSDYRASHREQIKEHNQEYYLRKQYGLTLETKDALFNSQGKRCAACGTNEAGTQDNPWHVDHVHDETRFIRGILCHKCNTALGFLNDEIERLRALERYLLKAEQRFLQETATNGDTQIPQGCLNA
jgi:hypothetical protein